MSDAIPFVSLTVRTEAGTEAEDRVIGDNIPFDSLAVGTEDGVMSDSVPFDSLSVGTAAVTGTEEPAPQAPPDPAVRRIPIPPSGAPIPDPTSIPDPIPIPIPVPPPAPLTASSLPAEQASPCSPLPLPTNFQ